MKLRKISEITATLPFTEFDFMQKYRDSFAVSEIGRIYAQLPLKELAEKIRSHNPKRHPQGNSPMFPPEGEVALMFLKSYTGLSDDGLIEMLNGSVHMQMFCGVLIDPTRPIKNGKIVSAIRNRIAGVLNIKELQKVLYERWQGSLHDKDLCLTDATCYESHLRFPTDVKLLWECCEWLQSLMSKTCKAQRERLPRNKYRDIDRARLAYAKQRKHTKTATKVTHVGADTIYANNENRRYCTENGIMTCFVRKGPKPKDDDEGVSTARRIIGTLRSTAMEGSFGNQKQHYGVGRIAARNSRSETLLLFFGIHMANAAILAARQFAIEEKKKQRQKRCA